MTYVHGTEPAEQERLKLMNRLINEPSLRELGLTGGERVLDVGCGLGQFTRMIARAAGRDSTVIGVERDAGQLDEARRQATADDEADLVELRAGDAMALPLSGDERGSFDLVYCRFVLEHLSDPLGAVRQMLTAARPGGRIALQDDDHDLMRLWPPCDPFDRAWRAYFENYYALSADPIIGRKLVALLYEAGARPMRSTWIFYGACAGDPDFRFFIDNVVGVLTGARALVVRDGRIDAAAFDDGVEALRVWARRPDAAFWYCMPYAEGIRP